LLVADCYSLIIRSSDFAKKLPFIFF